MNKYKVCVYAICKNEEKFVDRWVESMSEADVIVVTDTGSTDKTVEKLRNHGVSVYVEAVEPWRFDTARNISLGHVPEDTDICVCTDLDEVFEKGWREKLERAWKDDTKQGKYLYNWSHKADGTPDVQIYYSKIHSRQGFRWSYPVHEWLSYSGTEPKKTVFIEGMVLNHYPDSTKSRGSYLPLLEMAVEEDPQGDRVTYYLGREYMYKGQWEKCIDTLKRHLSLPTATWNEERCASMRWIAKSYYELKNIKECISWYFRAIAEAPHMRDPYVECAKICYLLGDWPMVLFMVDQALKIKKKSTTYVNMGYSWDHTPYDLGAIACYRLGMYELSLKYAKEALSYRPDDERLKRNLLLIKEKACPTKGREQEVKTDIKLMHTVLLLLREDKLEEDMAMLNTCLKSLENSTHKSVVIYNQGCMSSDILRERLAGFKLDLHIIGEGTNIGIPAGRQSCFKYIWDKFPETKYISEIHLDMYLSGNWEDPLIEYLETHEEPVICSGIIDRTGNMEFLGKKEALPESFDEYGEFLLKLRQDKVLHGFTHPCIHNSKILKEVGGYDLTFLKGKQCFEDDSLLLGYFYYYGTKSKWFPKVNFNSVAYHAIAGQRLSLKDTINTNYNGLIRQYGAMGIKHLHDIHQDQWHKNYFKRNFELLTKI